MATCGVDTQPESVRREVEAVWTCYQAVRNDSVCDPPQGLFEDARLRLGDWSTFSWRETLWPQRCVTVAGLVFWLLVALRIRHWAMIEASLAGPHGLASRRYGDSPAS